MIHERSLLFVPGDRPERFGKALAAGADRIVIDLEDAVLPSAKDGARDHIANWLSQAGSAEIAIRINGTDTSWNSEDLALAASSPQVVAIMLPKAEKKATVEAIAARLRRGQRLIALVETAGGYVDRLEIARARGVSRIAFGSVDFCAETGIGSMGDDLNGVRMELVIASAAAGLPAPIEGVTLETKGPAILAEDVGRARRLGFGGKLCIHPSQVAAVNELFSPSADELDWAHRVIAAASLQGAVVVDGKLVDKPVLDRARRLLAAAR
jgi:citrate lyase subunit beta/citryl-CoA lyase